MSLTVEDLSTNHEGLGMKVGQCMGIFYADDGMIGSRDTEWFQGAINVLIWLFRRIRFMANVAKSKTTTWQPGAIHTGMPEEAFSKRRKGELATYRNCMRQHIPCPECGVELTAGSMTAHCRLLHGTEPSIDCDWLTVSQTEHLPLVYEFILLTNMQSCQCPFPRCNMTSQIRSVLQNNFIRIHWRESILIIEEHPTLFPHYEHCKRQVTPWLLKNWHYNKKACRLGQ